MKFLIIFIMVLATALTFILPESQKNSSAAALQIEGRITNGYNATQGQFPYQVGLVLKMDDNKYSWCGGCLIGQQWILSVAHCTHNAQLAIVSLGATYRTAAEIVYTVYSNDIINHYGYNAQTFKNDISLIRIPLVSLNSKIQIVLLPAMSTSYSSYVGESAVASGWGRLSDAEEVVTDYLQWSRFKIITNTVCRKTFKFLTFYSMCVATSNDTSTCHGDSGGPLVTESTGILIGLTSFGHIDGCQLGYPTAFTRITSHLNWIKANTGIFY